MVYTVKRLNKYGAKKTTFNGRRYDSKHEASVAMWLQSEVDNGNILAFDTQFMTESKAYNALGVHVMTKKHKVDFRAHNIDGTFSLIEAKGFDTPDWVERRRWLEALWLPEHPDHDYTVMYNDKRKRRRR